MNITEELSYLIKPIINYLNDIHFIKFSILPAILLLSAIIGLNFWLKIEVLLSLIFGIALMIEPSARFFLEFQMKGKVDNNHLFLCSLLGCYIIYSALFPFKLKKSRDESVFISHFWSKIISSNLLFVTIGFAYLDGLRWNYNLLCFTGGAVLVTLLANTFFLMNSNSIRAQTHHALPANIVAKFEFFMLLSAGLILFAFPEQSLIDLKSANEGHRVLCRCCGVLLFSLSIESFTMPSFLFEKDKQSFLVARLIGSLLELVVIGLGIFYYGVITSTKAMTIYLFINMSYNFLIIIGIYSCFSKIRDLKHRVEANISSANASFSEKSHYNII